MPNDHQLGPIPVALPPGLAYFPALFRRHCRVSGSWWTTPSLCSNLVFGSDNRKPFGFDAGENRYFPAFPTLCNF
jgi:hypothetical protein